MKINNKTNVPTFYSASSPGVSECGTLDSGGTKDLPSLDSAKSVKVVFSFKEGNPSVDVPGNSQATIWVKQGG